MELFKDVTRNTTSDVNYFEDIKGKKILETAKEEENSDKLYRKSVLNYLRGVENMSVKRKVENYAKIQLQDLRKIGQKYLPLFSLVESSQTTIICGQKSISDIVKKFKQFGIALRIYNDIPDIFFT